MKVQDATSMKCYDMLLTHVMGYVGEQHVQRVVGKVVEGVDAVSGGRDAEVGAASRVMEDVADDAQGEPVSPAEALGVQVGICDGGGDGAVDAVGGIPDQHRPSVAAGDPVREGCSAAPVVTVAKRGRCGRAAMRKAADRDDGLFADDGSTDSAVLLESRSDVEGRSECAEDM